MATMTTHTEDRLEPSVRVVAMASIVEDLIAGGSARLDDDQWLYDQVTAADLNQQERTALEELRLRLREGGVARLTLTPLHWS